MTKDFISLVADKNYILVGNYISRFSIDLEASKDQMGNTALNIAAQAGDQKMVSLLLNKGASPYTKNLDGRSASDYSYTLFN